jgi:hypothetical protein
MSIDTSISMPVMPNILPVDVAADADDPRVADLVDTFPWANTHRCHDGMACQCAVSPSFIDAQPSSPPPDPTLDLPLPGVQTQCDCVNRGDRSGLPDMSSDIANKLLYIQRLGF